MHYCEVRESTRAFACGHWSVCFHALRTSPFPTSTLVPLPTTRLSVHALALVPALVLALPLALALILCLQEFEPLSQRITQYLWELSYALQYRIVWKRVTSAVARWPLWV